MRISTSQIYDSGALGIQNNQSGLYKLQNQISTGRRVLTPQDDPVAAAQALVVTQTKEVNKQYIENQGQAQSQLGLVDSQLSSLVNVLQEVRERVIQAGNTGTLSQSDRATIATDLESRLSEILGIANSDNGVGEYLFSGYKGNVRPFAIDGSLPPVPPATTRPVTYYGDAGERLLQVSSSRQMAVSVAGSDVFMIGNQSLFQTMQNLIGILRTPIGSTTYTATQYSFDLGKELTNLDQSFNNISTVQAQVGSRMQEIDSLGSALSDLDIQYQATLSDLQDLDYAKAISDFLNQKTNLEAAQQSFAKISGLSLFNYL